MVARLRAGARPLVLRVRGARWPQLIMRSGPVNVGRLSQRRGTCDEGQVRGTSLSLDGATVKTRTSAPVTTACTRCPHLPAQARSCRTESTAGPGPRSAALRTWCYVTNAANMAQRGSGSGRRGAVCWGQPRARASPTQRGL